MPNLDKKGPLGKGPKTGKQMGNCINNEERASIFQGGMGRGKCGRGMGFRGGRCGRGRFQSEEK